MHTDEQMAKKSDQISVRLDPDTFKALTEIHEKHGLEPVAVARRCLDAVAAFYRENGYFAFPVKLQPGDLWAEIHAKSAANYAGMEKEKAAETARAKATGKKAG